MNPYLSRRSVSIFLVAALALPLILFSLREPLRLTLREWTGEEDFWEGLKGTGALLFLKLTQPPLDTSPFVPISQVGQNPFGVNTFLEQEVEEEKLRRSLEMIRDAGFHWIRQEFPWEDIEIHGKGDFQDRRTTPYKSAWEKYDRMVDLAEEYGIEIIARLDQPPAWALAGEKPPGVIQMPPQNLEDFGDFVYAVVSRYRGRIHYYQIWNEPNLYVEWGAPPDSAAYAELLKVAYQRAKEADPKAVIISASLAPTIELGPQNISDLLYLQGMYAAGAKNYFDILGAQAFGLWTGPTDRRTDPSRTNFSRPLLLRQIMVENGDAAKPIWITEFGWNVVPEGMEAIWGRVTLEKQAEYAVQGYLRAMREWPWVGVINYWFFKRATDQERDQPFYYFRLVEPDFTPLLVYTALAELAQSEPFLGMGFHGVDHGALNWQGEWQGGAGQQGEYLFSTTPGDSLTFSFGGTDLSLVALADENSGTLQIFVDALPPREVDLYRTRDQGVEAPVATGLLEGLHRVRMQVLDKEGRTQAAIVGFIVDRRPTNFWLAVEGALILAVAASVYRMRRRR